MIDELSITNLKIFWLQEKIIEAKANNDHITISGHASSIMELNTRRNRLIKAIDEYVGVGDDSVTVKTYG